MNVFKSEKLKESILETYNQLLDMWGVEKEERDIMTTYGATHIIACGDRDKPPLLLFHGAGDNSALMWIYNAGYLSRYFRIYAVDTIGGPGKSEPDENYNNDFSAAAWTDEILSALNLDSVYIAGVSNGAYLAQCYGIRRPVKVKKIVCMAGTVPVTKHDPMKLIMKVFLPEALFPTTENMNKLMAKLCGTNIRAFTGNPVVMEHYLNLLKGFNNITMRHHRIESFDVSQLDLIRGKTLYLVGDADPFAAMGGKELLIRHKMNARFFPNVGHGINHEIADEINGIIVGYLLNN
jgi:pimeloyl-ACP methyl ester carboxylesterase